MRQRSTYLFLLLTVIMFSCKVPYEIRHFRSGYHRLRPATLDPVDRKLAATSILKNRLDFKEANFWFERSYSSELHALAGEKIRYSMTGNTLTDFDYLLGELVITNYSVPYRKTENTYFPFYISSSDSNGVALIRSMFNTTTWFTLLKHKDTIFSTPIKAYDELNLLSPEIVSYDKYMRYSEIIKWNKDTSNRDGIEVDVTCYQQEKIIESFDYITDDIGSLMLYHIYEKLPKQTSDVYLTLCRRKLVFIKGNDGKTYKISIASQVSTGYKIP